jgi:hypothetical protein
MTTAEAEYRVAPDTFAIRLDDDTLIWDPRTDQLHRLNPSATCVWEALREWTTAPAVTERVGAIEHEHVEACLVELRALRLVEQRTYGGGHSPMSGD